MIELSITYADLVWIMLLYALGAFLRGVGEGIGKGWKDKKNNKN